ncbi:MAG TPA: DUF58 domain-containing protein [Terriglobales bacterium]|nr:DUF58 domain-containing protein [Terriglobales bacterium]
MPRSWKVLTTIEREPWLRFLFAVGGLALAFAAAVFSTVERIAGNLVATVILASASLLLAAVVGLTTVPYLARRVVFRRVRDALDYEVTTEGIVYIGFTLIIGIAGLNTGNNLLFIVLSVMLSALLVSGMASAAVLRSIELELVVPEHVFAGTTALARIRVKNRRRWIPCFSVAVLPPEPAKHDWLRSERRKRKQAVKRERRKANAVVPAEPVLANPIYFPFVPAGTTITADVDLSFARRGRYSQESFGLATRFPFSLFLKTRRQPLPREVIVYPKIDPTDEALETLPMIRGEFESFVRGRGYDLYRIRDHVPEDSARHVDWKATAKTGELKVREFTREDERKLRIVFDNPAPGVLDESAYERAVGLAASLAWHFAGEDTQLTFVAPEYGGSAEIFDFLRYLALVQPAAGPPVIETLEPTDDYNLIITARDRGTAATTLWANSYFVFVK